MRALAVVALAAAALPAWTARANAQEPAGRWDVTWAQAVRRDRDGSVEIQRWGEARLVLERDANALSGTWFSDPGGVTWQITGTVDGNRIRLQATEHDSDDPQLAVAESMNWEGTLDGDRMEGTTWIVLLRPTGETARRPWRAERAPG